MKTFTGHVIIAGNEYEAIVAANSMRKAAVIADVTVHHISKYWSVTGNQDQIAAASASPETLLVRRCNSHDPYKALSSVKQP